MINPEKAKAMKTSILAHTEQLIDLAGNVEGMEITISISKEVIPTISYQVKGFPILPDITYRKDT